MRKRTMTRKELTQLAADLRGCYQYYLLWEKLRHAISTLPRTRRNLRAYAAGRRAFLRASRQQRSRQSAVAR